MRAERCYSENTTVTAVLVGGMDRLQPEYIEAAGKMGCRLSCVTRVRKEFESRLGSPNAVIIFTNKISHEAKHKAVQAAKSQGVQVILSHSCGLSSLKKCVGDIVRGKEA